jgi:DNA-binding XRE family transcriptional regulator
MQMDLDAAQGGCSAMSSLQDCVLGEETMTEERIARSLVHRFPEKVIVSGECGHRRKKDSHHPDYSLPFTVIRLCRSCHKMLHLKKLYESKNVNPVALKIRQFREEAQLTPGELAKKIGVPPQFISIWENTPNDKSITTRNLAKIADSLGKNADDFFIE